MTQQNDSKSGTKPSVIVRPAAKTVVDGTPEEVALAKVEKNESNMKPSSTVGSSSAGNTAAPTIKITEMPKPKPVDLGVQIGRQVNSFWTAPEWPTDADLTKESTWILRKNGIWNLRVNKIGTFLAHHTQTKLPAFPDENISESCVLRYGKIPYEIFKNILNFFKHYNDESHDEVYAQVFWNPREQKYFVEIPDQDVNGARVEFRHNHEVCDNNYLVAEIHSHNSMSANPSGTDNDDERSDRIFGIIGKLNQLRPEMTFSFVCAGKRVFIKYEDVFSPAPEGGEPFPMEWCKRVKKLSYGYGGGSGSSYGSSYGYGQGYAKTGQSSGYDAGRRMACWPGAEDDDEDFRYSPVQGLTPTKSATSEASTPEAIRKEVEEATEIGLEPILKSRNFMKDETSGPLIRTLLPTTTVKARETSPTTQTTSPAVVEKKEPEVSSSDPFFRRTGSTGKDTAAGKGLVSLNEAMATWQKEVEDEAWDHAFEQEICKIELQFRNQDFLEEPMKREDKAKMFRDLMSFLDDEDIQVLSDTMVESGHQELMQTSIDLAAFEVDESRPPEKPELIDDKK